MNCLIAASGCAGKYGYFSPDAREYVITRPDTPTPWINYISNLSGYCGIISQTAGGFSFHKDPRDRRITKYRYNNVPVDRPGRYFYIKDMETGEYWSPTYQPVMRPPDFFECRHGLGYSVISSGFAGIRHEVGYFVPLDEPCEIWLLKITNPGAQRKTLSVYSYSEFTLWCEPESRNIQWSLHLTRGSFEESMVTYQFIEPHPAFDMNANADYKADRPGFAFMGMSEEVLDFECVRDKFLGLYQSETNPAGLKTERLSNSILRGGIGCAALRTQIELEPGGEKEFVVILGFAENNEEAVAMRKHFRDPKMARAELDRVKASWTEYLAAFRVQSPEEGLNTMLNVWNQYQCKTTFDWSRYISFYENGEGRGMGTRDSAQDTLAIAAHLAERCRSRIFQILSTCQFETGDCYHQFFPLGGRGDLKGFSDDHLWLIRMVHAYIAETGDFGILEEECGFADSLKKAPVWEHLRAAVDYTQKMTGPHGLPLILTADWNDTLHLWMAAQEPESVLIAQFYVDALKLLAELAEVTGRKTDELELTARAFAMSVLVNEICWDGEWYLRGFGKTVIGTHTSERAKIFLNTQSWAVISGAATPERARRCMESVFKHLASEEGIKNLAPPFEKYDQTYGLISRYNTGRKENGIFAHANAWAIIAEALLGRPEIAMSYYRNILPLKNNEHPEILKTEPYVFCQTVCSNDSINPGEGANSWLTGTASWMYVAATQYLLGIKPTLAGLRIQPCIPASWPGFTVKRRYRGCLYDIEVRRGKEKKIICDGKTIDGNILVPNNSRLAQVIVELET
jgi:cellobiose phosphorylase